MGLGVVRVWRTRVAQPSEIVSCAWSCANGQVNDNM